LAFYFRLRLHGTAPWNELLLIFDPGTHPFLQTLLAGVCPAQKISSANLWLFRSGGLPDFSGKQHGLLHPGRFSVAHQSALGQLTLALGTLAFGEMPSAGPSAHHLARRGDFKPLGHRFARLTSRYWLWHRVVETISPFVPAKHIFCISAIILATVGWKAVGIAVGYEKDGEERFERPIPFPPKPRASEAGCWRKSLPA
jgi:hypothetical protein